MNIKRYFLGLVLIFILVVVPIMAEASIINSIQTQFDRIINRLSFIISKTDTQKQLAAVNTITPTLIFDASAVRVATRNLAIQKKLQKDFSDQPFTVTLAVNGQGNGGDINVLPNTNVFIGTTVSQPGFGTNSQENQVSCTKHISAPDGVTFSDWKEGSSITVSNFDNSYAVGTAWVKFTKGGSYKFSLECRNNAGSTVTGETSVSVSIIEPTPTITSASVASSWTAGESRVISWNYNNFSQSVNTVSFSLCNPNSQDDCILFTDASGSKLNKIPSGGGSVAGAISYSPYIGAKVLTNTVLTPRYINSDGTTIVKICPTNSNGVEVGVCTKASVKIVSPSPNIAKATVKYSPDSDWIKGKNKTIIWTKESFSDKVDVWLCKGNNNPASDCQILIKGNVDNNGTFETSANNSPNSADNGSFWYFYVRKAGDTTNSWPGNNFSKAVKVTVINGHCGNNPSSVNSTSEIKACESGTASPFGFITGSLATSDGWSWRCAGEGVGASSAYCFVKKTIPVASVVAVPSEVVKGSPFTITWSPTSNFGKNNDTVSFYICSSPDINLLGDTSKCVAFAMATNSGSYTVSAGISSSLLLEPERADNYIFVRRGPFTSSSLLSGAFSNKFAIVGENSRYSAKLHGTLGADSVFYAPDPNNSFWPTKGLIKSGETKEFVVYMKNTGSESWTINNKNNTLLLATGQNSINWQLGKWDPGGVIDETNYYSIDNSATGQVVYQSGSLVPFKVKFRAPKLGEDVTLPLKFIVARYDVEKRQFTKVTTDSPTIQMTVSRSTQTPQACTSYTLGNWGICTDGKQTRALTKVPTGCDLTSNQASEIQSAGGTEKVCAVAGPKLIITGGIEGDVDNTMGKAAIFNLTGANSLYGFRVEGVGANESCMVQVGGTANGVDYKTRTFNFKGNFYFTPTSSVGFTHSQTSDIVCKKADEKNKLVKSNCFDTSLSNQLKDNTAAFLKCDNRPVVSVPMKLKPEIKSFTVDPIRPLYLFKPEFRFKWNVDSGVKNNDSNLSCTLKARVVYVTSDGGAKLENIKKLTAKKSDNTSNVGLVVKASLGQFSLKPDVCVASVGMNGSVRQTCSIINPNLSCVNRSNGLTSDYAILPAISTQTGLEYSRQINYGRNEELVAAWTVFVNTIVDLLGDLSADLTDGQSTVNDVNNSDSANANNTFTTTTKFPGGGSIRYKINDARLTIIPDKVISCVKDAPAGFKAEEICKPGVENPVAIYLPKEGKFIIKSNATISYDGVAGYGSQIQEILVRPNDPSLGSNASIGPSGEIKISADYFTILPGPKCSYQACAGLVPRLRDSEPGCCWGLQNIAPGSLGDLFNPNKSSAVVEVRNEKGNYFEVNK